MENQETGLRCPKCGCRYLKVTNTYHNTVQFNGLTYSHTRRRRVCQNRDCYHAFYTRECVEDKSVAPDEIGPGQPPDLLSNPFL